MMMKKNLLIITILTIFYSISTQAQTQDSTQISTTRNSLADQVLIDLARTRDSIQVVQKELDLELKQKQKEEKEKKILLAKEEKERRKLDKARLKLEATKKQVSQTNSEISEIDSAITAPLQINKAEEKEVVEAPVNAELLSNLTISRDSLNLHNSHVVVRGNNVIIGNNNTIYIVGEKVKLDKKPEIKHSKRYTADLFQHFSVGLRASTLGPGIELATSLSKNFTLRAGVDYIKFSFKESVEVKDEHLSKIVVGDYNPDYKFKANLKLYNAHALIDFYPMRNGIFHITAGAYFGKNRIKVKGELINPETKEKTELKPGNVWPNLSFNHYLINIDDANIDAELKLGKEVKPYFGIGLGRSIPRNRFGFKFELGALYQGNVVIKQNGHELIKDKDMDDSFVDSKKYINWLKWWPMVNVQLVYRF